MSHDVTNKRPRLSATFRSRLIMGAILVASGYAAWLIIPVVVASDLAPNIKAALTAFFSATPLLTKLVAVALLGRPTLDFLKRHSVKFFRRGVGDR
ncbi:MAG TPA: hypothetical protein VFK91_06555 [Methyloceanibacter sp.]|nr:hypothetical protein [Methyloceanibacter sp.]